MPMNPKDQKISDVLSRYGEDFEANIWRVQGTAVIYHKALERIAEKAGIDFNDPIIVRAERDEAVLMVAGVLVTRDADGNLMEIRKAWSFGEAVINVNYRVSGKQAAYVFAMAEKRAKDRVILKLLEISGMVYSEEEADEFRADPRNTPPAQKKAAPPVDDWTPDLTESQAKAERLLVALRTLRGVSEVEKWLGHPKVKDALEEIDMDDYSFVMKIACEQRALGPEGAAE